MYWRLLLVLFIVQKLQIDVESVVEVQTSLFLVVPENLLHEAFQVAPLLQMLLLGVLLDHFLAYFALGRISVALDCVLHCLRSGDDLFAIRALHVLIHLICILFLNIPLNLTDSSPFLLRI